MPPRQSALPPVRAFFPSPSPYPSLFPSRQKQQRTKGKDKGQMTRVWQPRGERVANHGKRQRWPAVRQVQQPIRSPKKVPGKRNGWRALRTPQRPIRQAPKPMPEVAAYHVHGLDHVRFHFSSFFRSMSMPKTWAPAIFCVPVCGSKEGSSCRSGELLARARSTVMESINQSGQQRRVADSTWHGRRCLV